MLLLHMLLTWSELLVSDLKEVARSTVSKVLKLVHNNHNLQINAFAFDYLSRKVTVWWRRLGRGQRKSWSCH